MKGDFTGMTDQEAQDSPWMTPKQIGSMQYELHQGMTRCRAISGSERLIGQEESADLYRSMAEEIRAAIVWVTQTYCESARDSAVAAHFAMYGSSELR